MNPFRKKMFFQTIFVGPGIILSSD